MIVSLITLWLAGRQRAKAERQAEERRRQAILDEIGCELRWNRTAPKGTLDAGNAHYMIGKLSTVALERHGADMAMIAPGGVEVIFEHYSTVARCGKAFELLQGRPIVRPTKYCVSNGFNYRTKPV